MTEITLTRKELEMLAAIAVKFEDVDWFNIQQTHESGIGASTVVKCSLFDNDSEPETTIDITDVSAW